MGEGHLSVVLATYNEVEAIGPMIQQLLSQLDREGGPSLEVIVVDDDSPDGTADVDRSVWRIAHESCCVQGCHPPGNRWWVRMAQSGQFPQRLAPWWLWLVLWSYGSS